MIIPSQNQKLAQKYFKTLDENDESVKFYNGKIYQPSTNFFSKIYNMLFLNESRLQTLKQFYPHQNTVDATYIEYHQLKNHYSNCGIILSLISAYVIYGFAQQNYVFPILNQYGKFFKTHRIFRHYIWALIGPQLISQLVIRHAFNNHIDHCWTVHSKRMNQKILEDPEFTFYPKYSIPALKNY